MAKSKSEKKQAVLDIFKMLFSNCLHLVSGVLVGLLIPKMLGYQDYGFYQTFVLYVSYLGILDLGISDGVYFSFAGKPFDDLAKKKLHSIILFLFLLEISFSIVGCCISFCFISFSKYGVIFLFISIYNVVLNMEYLFSFICQAIKKFSWASIVSVVKAVINIIYVTVCYLLFKYSSVSLDFIVFITLTITSSFIADTIYVLKLKKVIFAKGENAKEVFMDVKHYFLVGIPLFFANLTTQILMSVDKQCISIFYPVELSNIFSTYSFAYSMLGLITVFTSAVSSVLFPYMVGKDQEKLVKSYPSLNLVMNICMGIACFSYFFLVWFIDVFMSKYNGSLPIFRILLPGLAVNSIVVVLMHSYYKTFNKEKAYFLQNIVVLALAIGADALVYFCFIKPLTPNDPILITVSSLIVICIWYIISESYLIKKYHIKHWKNDFYIFSIVGGFLLFTTYFDLLTSFVIYLVFFIGLTLTFYGKEISLGIKMVKTKQKQKKELKEIQKENK